MSDMRMRFRGNVAPVVQPRARTPNTRNLILTLLITFLLVSLIVLFAGQFPPAPTALPPTEFTYQQLKVQDDEVLNTYGWVDRAEGQVRIPITEAMRLIAERGLPVRPESEQATAP